MSQGDGEKRQRAGEDQGRCFSRRPTRDDRALLPPHHGARAGWVDQSEDAGIGGCRTSSGTRSAAPVGPAVEQEVLHRRHGPEERRISRYPVEERSRGSDLSRSFIAHLLRVEAFPWLAQVARRHNGAVGPRRVGEMMPGTEAGRYRRDPRRPNDSCTWSRVPPTGTRRPYGCYPGLVGRLPDSGRGRLDV